MVSIDLQNRPFIFLVALHNKKLKRKLSIWQKQIKNNGDVPLNYVFKGKVHNV